MSSVVSINVPEFAPEKEYDFDRDAERRAILKERLSRLNEHQLMLDSVAIEIRENEEKSAKALADFRTLQRELDSRRNQCQSAIGQCNQAKIELLEIAPPDLRARYLKLKDSLRLHENYLEGHLKDVPVFPFLKRKIELSQTREELDRWVTRLEDFEKKKAELDAAIAATESEILSL